MAQTIEDVNDRTLLQQFHSLYKKQDEIETNVENVDAKVVQEKSDRQSADQGLQKLIYQEATERGNETASLRNDLNTNTNKIEYNATQITALKSDKQDKLTAGTNITIDENNIISASGGGITAVKAENIDSESATSGQVLTANGNGGASWQNASGGQLYEHIIKINNCIFLSIKTESNIAFTSSTFSQWLTDNGYVWPRKWLMANGCFLTSNEIFFVTGVIKDGSLLRAGGNLISIDSNMNISQKPGINTILTISILEDEVTEL